MIRRLLLPLILLASPAAAMDGPVPARVSACCTPGPKSCARRIVSGIDSARATIRVQAYVLTDPQIARALAQAKRRGVDVQAILDRSQTEQRYSAATYLARAGIPVWIDTTAGIAHSKVAIIDARLVITGSANFTKAADSANIENIVVLESPDVARWFTAKWEARLAVSRAFEGE